MTTLLFLLLMLTVPEVVEGRLPAPQNVVVKQLKEEWSWTQDGVKRQLRIFNNGDKMMLNNGKEGFCPKIIKYYYKRGKSKESVTILFNDGDMVHGTTRFIDVTDFHRRVF